MKKLFLLICLFLAVCTTQAQNFVPDPTVYYNIRQNTSMLVIGAIGTGTAPVVQTLANTGAQAFKFTPVAGLTDTYNVQSYFDMYFAGSGYTTVYEKTINATVGKSQWVISGTDASTIRLKVVASNYIASDAIINNSALYCDKPATNANGVFSLVPATVTPAITLSEKNAVLEIEKDLKPYPLYVSGSKLTDNVDVSVPAGYTVSPSTITPADFTTGLGKVKVEINTTTSIGDTAKIMFTYTRAGITYKMDSVRATPVATYNRYYLTHKSSGYAIGGLATNNLYPALTAKAKAVTQRLIFRRVNPKITPNDSIYYVVQDGDYRMLRKVTTSGWDTEFGASGNEAKWTLKRQANGTFSLTNAVTLKALGTDNINLEGRLYDDKVFTLNAVAKPFCEWIIDDVNALDVSKTTLSFDNLNKTRTFTVLGSAVTTDVTLVAPAGITLDKTTLTIAEMQTGVLVTATFDNTTTILNGTITVTSAGSTSKSITVNSSVDNGCFTPLYADRTNLVVNPYLNSLETFGGWGSTAINTDPLFVYCGSNSGKLVGSGSIDQVLTGIMTPNTTYRVRGMVYAATTAAQIGVFGWGGAADITNLATITGAWAPIDFTFTSKATLAATQGIFFNNSTGSYIDNWEMYDISNIDAALATITVAGGTLSPAFTSATTTYSVVLPVGTATVTPVAVANIAGATITGADAVDVSSGTGTSTILVTSSNGTVTKTYTLNYQVAIATGINTPTQNLFASVEGQQVKVQGTVAGDKVKVYNVSGQLIHQSTAISNSTTINLKSGVYLIKVNATTLKIVK